MQHAQILIVLSVQRMELPVQNVPCPITRLLAEYVCVVSRTVFNAAQAELHAICAHRHFIPAYKLKAAFQVHLSNTLVM